MLRIAVLRRLLRCRHEDTSRNGLADMLQASTQVLPDTYRRAAEHKPDRKTSPVSVPDRLLPALVYTSEGSEGFTD